MGCGWGGLQGEVGGQYGGPELGRAALVAVSGGGGGDAADVEQSGRGVESAGDQTVFATLSVGEPAALLARPAGVFEFFIPAVNTTTGDTIEAV